MKKFVEIGSYYNIQPYGLIKTICRAYDYETGEAMIVYANVNDGGYVSDAIVLPECDFVNMCIG